jgi:hypothetical protein
MIASRLSKWLRNESNSKSREHLTTARAIHDLMTAAAACDYDLLVYTPTVDRDGFDLILDDRDHLVPLQLKSVISGGRAQSWSIHRRLLRPERRDVELFGFEPSPFGEGRGGGVVLLSLHPHEADMSVRYRYTDINVLSALWLGLFRLPKQSVACLKRLRGNLEAKPSGRVALPRSAFITARSPEHLLALAGLHSRVGPGAWPHYLRLLLAHSNHHSPRELPAPAETLRAELGSCLSQLVTEPIATLTSLRRTP